MKNEERIQALRVRKYTPAEAEFLVLVALHSGYFLRRQYLRFLGAHQGYRDHNLVQKLLDRGHGHTRKLFKNTEVFHLSSHSLYAAIGESENRHRRRRSPRAALRKIMGLDFVLDRLGQVEFLATEDEKIGWFARAGITKKHLPKRIYRSLVSDGITTRYFVDKFPLFLDKESTPGFAYIDYGETQAKGFATHLRKYSPLLRRLDRARLVYVACRPRWIDRARAKFDRLTRPAGEGEERSLRMYFRLEKLYREKQFDRLSDRDLIRLKRARFRFAAKRYQELFERWLSAGDEAFRVSSFGAGLLFESCLIEHDYAVFGTTI